MKILGISALYHDSAAALCIDGKIVAAVQEERFTRKKADAGVPRYSIEYCLEKLNGELDAVVYYDDVWMTVDRWLKNSIAESAHSEEIIGQRIDSITREKIWIKERIYAFIPLEKRRNTKFYCCRHHMSHAASAFYPSPYQEAAILTVDGVGEWATTTLGIGRGKDIHLLKKIDYPHSLGLLYSAFTYFCGFRVNTGEYKLMGLAPYGEPVYKNIIFEHLIDVKEDGSYALNLDFFEYTHANVMVGEKFEKLFGIKRRVSEERITKPYMDMAASVQVVLEEIILKLAIHLKVLTNCSNLVIAGGIALNCVANGKLKESGLFENIWVQPAAGDAGGAVGAALFAEYMSENSVRAVQSNDSMQGAFLGPNYSDEKIEQFLGANGCVYCKYEGQALYDRIAEFLSEEKVVGLFQGRMEFGPRALGARSIIASPISRDMQSRLNLKIKFRESFRPFAPAVLKEDVNKYFDMEYESPYMLFVEKVKKELQTSEKRKETDDLIQIVNQSRSQIPAVTHVDYSARIQTVDSERNPYFYEVIKAFKKLTGFGVVVNTSFNVRGEPIVCTPKDAWFCFMGTDMDVLVLENYVLLKQEQPTFHKSEDWRSRYEPD